MKLGKIPTSRKLREKWGTHYWHSHRTSPIRSRQRYLKDLTAAASSSFTSKTVYSFVI
jgi:hypothetical protein